MCLNLVLDGAVKLVRSRKKSKIKYVILTVVLLAIVIPVIISAARYEVDEVFRNDKQFRKYVDHYYEVNKINDVVDVDKIIYEYGEPISFATVYTKCNNEVVKSYMEEKVRILKSNYASTYSADSERVRALLISTSVFNSDNGAISLSVHESSRLEADGKMASGSNEIYTYHFSAKNGAKLVPEQMFIPEYREYCSDYFMEYFMSNYKHDELSDGWEQHLSPTDGNFNKFIVSEDNITFFFEEGDILKENNGHVTVGLTGKDSERILRDKVIKRYIDPDKPMVALTYDDGPGGESEDRILDCLERNNAVATFFYQGVFIEGREDKIVRAKDLGCEIGGHTWNHPLLTDLETKDLKKQFDRTNAAIYEACGAYPTVFRPSYGETNSKINKLSKLPVIMWSVDTMDWESRNGKKVFNVVKKTKNLDGKIILMHSIHDSTADATELIIPWLQDNGYQIVTVSELIKYKTGADPIPGKEYRTYK